MVGISVWIVAKSSPPLGLELVPPCCAIYTYLKFLFGSSSYGKFLLVALTVF